MGIWTGSVAAAKTVFAVAKTKINNQNRLVALVSTTRLDRTV